MTTLHKLTLAGIAGICMLVIAMNFKTSTPAATNPPPAAVIETTPTPARANTGSTSQTDSLVLGPRLTEARGLDDLVTEIREVTKNEAAPVKANPLPRRESRSPISDFPRNTATDHASAPIVEPAKDAVGASTESPEQSHLTAREIIATIEPQTLTLGPPPSTANDSRPDVTDEDLSAFSDLPEELELPPSLDDPAYETSRLSALNEESESFSDPVDITTNRDPSSHEKVAVASKDSEPLPADPPGTVAPVDAPPPAALAKANEPAQAAKPPVVKSNEPAAAEQAEPAKRPKKKNPPKEEPPASSPVTVAPENPKTYTIQPGDTYSSIAIVAYGAERHWIQIADANPDVDPKRLKVGQVIKLPGIESESTDVSKSTATKQAPPTEPKAAEKSEDKVHVVKAGENLWTISRQYFDTTDHWRHIYLANRETIGSDPGKLQAGMKLKITPPKDSN